MRFASSSTAKSHDAPWALVPNERFCLDREEQCPLPWLAPGVRPRSERWRKSPRGCCRAGVRGRAMPALTTERTLSLMTQVLDLLRREGVVPDPEAGDQPAGRFPSP
jgi:hypothetical protein